VSSNPENADYRLLKAQVERHWLAFIQLDNEPSDTAEAFHAARATLEKLVQDFPNEPLYQAELADTLSMVSTRLSSVAPAEAIRYLSEAIDLSKKLTSLSPTSDAYRALSVTCFLKLARIYRSQNAFDLAYTCYTTARDLLGDLVSDRPTHAYYQTNLMLATAELSDLLREQNERTRDKTYLDESKTLLESAIHDFVESRDLENDPYRRPIAIKLIMGSREPCGLLAKSVHQEPQMPRPESYQENAFREIQRLCSALTLRLCSIEDNNLSYGQNTQRVRNRIVPLTKHW
jgi:tetratricopeptide (TPR) repeat protein